MVDSCNPDTKMVPLNCLRSLPLQIMKFFAFIMAIIVFALSCMPCKDGMYAMDRSKAKIENLKSQNQKEHGTNDACSPFCTCNCCAGFAFQFSAIKVENTVHVLAKVYSPGISSPAIAISLPIWQPPQLL